MNKIKKFVHGGLIKGMFKSGKIFINVIFVFLFLPLVGGAQTNSIDLYFFEGRGCSFCARMKSFLEGLKSDYPNLKVYGFEVYFNKENQILFEKMAEAYGERTSGVPTIFIDDTVISGADFEKVKNAVERCSLAECISPMSKINSADADSNSNENGDANQSTAGRTKNEIAGWIVIGFLGIAGLFLLMFYLKKKKNV
jgi:glutaredoxin